VSGHISVGQARHIAQTTPLPEGFRVRAHHCRLSEHDDIEGLRAMRPQDRKAYIAKYAVDSFFLRSEGETIVPHGGATLVEVQDAEGNTVVAAQAVCSPEDVYCKRVGREIALGRALASL
jgi:hypothetical protein